MTKKKRTTEPQFGLDMSFGEALERFIQTDPKEVEASIAKSKRRKPPDGDAKAKPSGGSNQSDAVVSLRSRRMRKRNTGR